MLAPVPQGHDYGCGVACVANLLNTSYDSALELFGPNAEHKAQTEGFYLEEMCAAMRHAGWISYWVALQPFFVDKVVRLNNIVFLEPTTIMPAGHYVVRERLGWYNSWVNFPERPPRAEIQKELPGMVQYIIFNRRR